AWRVSTRYRAQWEQIKPPHQNYPPRKSRNQPKENKGSIRILFEPTPSLYHQRTILNGMAPATGILYRPAVNTDSWHRTAPIS
ncbi:MAG TPA: hypothetical protein DDZ90_04350, partial [Planctomycetaceae bacterium]|nr:hypothetical protein [Planctomycetaceae bacterium]